MTGDAASGEGHALRHAVEARGKGSCCEVHTPAEVWTTDPRWQVPPAQGTRGRIIERRHGQPGPEGWMMVRRPLGAGLEEAKDDLSNAPQTVSLAEMAWVGCWRWTVEENFELAKGEVGLDHSEVTKYRGWSHPITLLLLALAFLKAVQRAWGKKSDCGQRAGGAGAAPGCPAPGRVESGKSHCLTPPAAPPPRRRHRVAPEALAA